MNLRRFGELVEAYGAEPQRWPAAERAAAQALLSGSADARALQERARALDLMLDRFEPVVELDAARMAAQLQQRLDAEPGVGLFVIFGPLRRRIAVAGLLLIFGMALGFGLPQGSSAQMASGQMASGQTASSAGVRLMLSADPLGQLGF